MLTFALASVSCFSLIGCNTSSEQKNKFISAVSGDTIILTSDGMISSINRDNPNNVVSSIKIRLLEAEDQLVGIDYRPKDEKLYAVGLLGNSPTRELLHFFGNSLLIQQIQRMGMNLLVKL